MKLGENTLLNTIHSFPPLQVGNNAKELEIWDKKLVNYLRRATELTLGDEAHMIFLSEKIMD